MRRSRGHVVGGRTKCASRHEGPWRPPPPGWVGEQAHICSLFCVLCMSAHTLLLLCSYMYASFFYALGVPQRGVVINMTFWLEPPQPFFEPWARRELGKTSASWITDELLEPHSGVAAPRRSCEGR